MIKLKIDYQVNYEISNNKNKKIQEGFRTYTTTYYPNIPISDSDTFILAKEGSRLDSLANEYYGDTKLWWVLAKSNGIRGKIALKAGELIRIPGNITKIIDDFEAINETGDSTSSVSGGSTGGGGGAGGGGGGY